MSPVATDDTATSAAAGQKWTRTPEQQALVDEHLDLVRRLYADADPALRAKLQDTTIWGTAEVEENFGLSGKTRVFQWYSTGRELDEADQTPHPAGAPEPDAFGGYRGNREIRGSIAGRWRMWAMMGGKLHWDPIARDFVRETRFNSGGAPVRRP